MASPRSPRWTNDRKLVFSTALPRFVRLKSQSLCKFLTVSKDGKGRLAFSSKMNQVDPSMVFEMVHVDVPSSQGRKVVKIKSTMTKKFWKRISNAKVPQCKVPKDAKEGVGAGIFNIIMAIANNEGDGDVFEYETIQGEEGGQKAKTVALWNPTDKRFLAPHNVIQNNITHESIDFLGCMSKEKRFNTGFFLSAIYHHHEHLEKSPIKMRSLFSDPGQLADDPEWLKVTKVPTTHG
ncbi:unnamed protein product [Calypogeia fissa]